MEHCWSPITAMMCVARLFEGGPPKMVGIPFGVPLKPTKEGSPKKDKPVSESVPSSCFVLVYDPGFARHIQAYQRDPLTPLISGHCDYSLG